MKNKFLLGMLFVFVFIGMLGIASANFFFNGPNASYSKPNFPDYQDVLYVEAGEEFLLNYTFTNYRTNTPGSSKQFLYRYRLIFPQENDCSFYPYSGNDFYKDSSEPPFRNGTIIEANHSSGEIVIRRPRINSGFNKRLLAPGENMTFWFKANCSLATQPEFLNNNLSYFFYTNKSQISTKNYFSHGWNYAWQDGSSSGGGQGYLYLKVLPGDISKYSSLSKPIEQEHVKDAYITLETLPTKLPINYSKINLYNSTSLVSTYSGNNSFANFSNSVSNLSDGRYSYDYLFQTSYGGNFSSNGRINFILDRTSPLIKYESKTYSNDSLVNDSYIPMEVYVNESNMDRLHYHVWDSTRNLTFDFYDYRRSDGTGFFNLGSLNDGIYYYTVKAYDRAKNFASTETRKITLDENPPVVNYTVGTLPNNSTPTQTNVFVNVSVFEMSEKNITFNLYNSISPTKKLVSSKSYSGNKTRFVDFTGLSLGTYYYEVSVWDIFNRSASTPIRKITLMPITI